MRVFVKEPNQQLHQEIVKNEIMKDELEALQELVGGYIESVRIARDMVMIVNEEGKLLGLPYNFTMGNDDIVGTVVFAGVSGARFCDVPISLERFEKLFPKMFQEKGKAV